MRESYKSVKDPLANALFCIISSYANYVYHICQFMDFTGLYISHFSLYLCVCFLLFWKLIIIFPKPCTV